MTRVLKSSLRAHRHCFSLYVQYLAATCCASSAANGSCCECEPYEDCRHLSIIDFFVGIPLIAGGVGFAARKGWPRNFSRARYLVAFWGLGLASGVLIVSAQQMRPEDVWHQLLQEVFGVLEIGRASCRER